MKENLVQNLSNVGSGLSFACAIHCVAMPFLIAVLPAVGLSFLAHCWVEMLVLGLSVAVSTLSLCWGYRVHGSLSALPALVAGALWFFVAAMSHHNLLFNLIGGACFVAANITNRLLCKSCDHCECKHG